MITKKGHINNLTISNLSILVDTGGLALCLLLDANFFQICVYLFEKRFLQVELKKNPVQASKPFSLINFYSRPT